MSGGVKPQLRSFEPQALASAGEDQTVRIGSLLRATQVGQQRRCCSASNRACSPLLPFQMGRTRHHRTNWLTMRSDRAWSRCIKEGDQRRHSVEKMNSVGRVSLAAEAIRAIESNERAALNRSWTLLLEATCPGLVPPNRPATCLPASRSLERLMRRYALRETNGIGSLGHSTGTRGSCWRDRRDNRLFVDAVIYRYRLASHGATCPDASALEGVHTRFSRWAKSGVWRRLFEPCGRCGQRIRHDRQHHRARSSA